MEYTGERLVPEKADSRTFWEHIYRYRFATQFAKGRRVLDIACGEGYGSAALLQAGAASVVGIDISTESCRHASQKYNVATCAGNGLCIPVQDKSVDLVVSFETIEHIQHPEQFITECWRVLAPNGLLIISTPNRDVYSAGGKHNPFHHLELNQVEFTELLNRHFTNWHLYTQTPKKVALWSIRSFAASNTDWVNVKGFWRIRDILRKITSPHLWSSSNSYHTELNPVQIVTAKDQAISSITNPYMVKKWQNYHREHAMYLIAVAHR